MDRLTHMVDLAVVLAANLMNLLLVGMFILRAKHRPSAARIAGWMAVSMAIPLLAALVVNLLAQREWPFWLLPLITIAYCVLELLLDGILKIEFRQSRLLGPYLALYYLGLMAMIGYAFLVGKPFGFITLLTYFVNLGATAFSYARVGHGMGKNG
ncbi:MAG: hypothetical protein IH586_06310 [Anaerolineaceae bacterium]|nr:hypothetical protein [Anaerolineaceae bacterium]